MLLRQNVFTLLNTHTYCITPQGNIFSLSYRLIYFLFFLLQVLIRKWRTISRLWTIHNKEFISYLSGLSIQVRLKLIIIQGILLGHSSVLH